MTPTSTIQPNVTSHLYLFVTTNPMQTLAYLGAFALVITGLNLFAQTIKADIDQFHAGTNIQRKF